MTSFKNTFLILFVFLVSNACFDQPRDRSTVAPTSQTQSNPYLNNRPSGSVVIPGSQGGSDAEQEDSSNQDDQNDSESPGLEDIIPDEIKHCQWSADGQTGFASSNNSHLGAHTICQSQTSEANIYIQVKNPVTDSQVCIIPSYNSGQTSVYIGEPRCLMLNDNKKIYKVTLLKNRPGYSSFAITSVMVMKDKAFFYPPPYYQNVLSPDAYLFCSEFLDKFGDSSYCQAFKSVGQYVYKQF